MSVNIDLRVVAPGDDTYVDDAWELKERIRMDEGFLRQRVGFFKDAYRRSTGYVLLERGPDGDEVVGFASCRRDGYILFLAVGPEHRGEGYARRLVAAVADDHGSVTCHARTTNEAALGFYEHLGFRIVRRVENYYEDHGDAYYLRLGDEGIKEKLSRFMRR